MTTYENATFTSSTGAASQEASLVERARHERSHQTGARSTAHTLYSLVTAGTVALEQCCMHHRNELRQFDGIWQRMRAASPSVMARSLWELGFLRDPKDAISPTAIAAQCRSTPSYEPLMAQWLQVLATAGFVRTGSRSDSFYAAQSFDIAPVLRDIDTALSAVDVPTRYPGFIEYFKTCVSHQTDLLTGRSNPQKLLFPAGSSRLVDGLYRDNPASALQNSVAAAIVSAAARMKHEARALRILEIGAGTGATTASVIAGLASTHVDYYFTDVSRFFLRRAARRFEAYPWVSYEILDIDRPPLEQGFEPRSFDVIVAANVLHTAKDIGVTLNLLRDLLSNGGALVAIETTSNTALQMITFGHFEAVCHFQDERRHSKLPFLMAAEWRAALHGAGFGDVAMVSPPANDPTAWMQHVLVGIRGEV